jgi:SAM-dependent methyltransferase
MSNEINLEPEELVEISATTIGHYDSAAQSFWQGTKDHDVSKNRGALLRHIEGDPPFRILDLGCGPGRDLIAFGDAGHEPTGLDGASSFCEMAHKVSGFPVLHQNLFALDLPAERFDGVFANAVLFHVPTQELLRVLGELYAALEPRGVELEHYYRPSGRPRAEQPWLATVYRRT